jgi:hypothetical protein
MIFIAHKYDRDQVDQLDLSIGGPFWGKTTDSNGPKWAQLWLIIYLSTRSALFDENSAKSEFKLLWSKVYGHVQSNKSICVQFDPI